MNGLRIAARRSLVAMAILWLATAHLFLASQAMALPRIGDSWLPVRVYDAWDQSVDLSSVAGKPLLVVYEDKDSAKLNAEFKQALAQMANGGRYLTRVTLVAVADVSGYDYWPIRGFVKGSIRSESARQRTDIYCDWDGAFRRQLSLEARTSNVLLYGKDGKLLFAHSGALSPAERTQLIGLIEREVE